MFAKDDKKKYKLLKKITTLPSQTIKWSSYEHFLLLKVTNK